MTSCSVGVPGALRERAVIRLWYWQNGCVRFYQFIRIFQFEMSHQQRVLAGMLGRIGSGRSSVPVDKELCPGRQRRNGSSALPRTDSHSDNDDVAAAAILHAFADAGRVEILAMG